MLKDLYQSLILGNVVSRLVENYVTDWQCINP